MDAFDADGFVDDLGQSLAMGASDEVRDEIFSNDALASEILGFQHDAKDGLARVVAGVPGAASSLESVLRSRKTSIVASAQRHAYQIERLVAKALESIVSRAREIG